MKKLITLFVFLGSFFSMIQSVKAQTPAKSCARNQSELASIPELDLLVKKTQGARDGKLRDLLGVWKTQVLTTGVKVQFNSGASGFDTRIKVGKGDESESLGASICYLSQDEAYMKGSDGKVIAFIKVTNTYDPAKPNRKGKVEVQISKPKINRREKTVTAEQYYTFRKDFSASVQAETITLDPVVDTRSGAPERAPASVKPDGAS
jgi:hypothetical protein